MDGTEKKVKEKARGRMGNKKRNTKPRGMAVSVMTIQMKDHSMPKP